MKAGSLFSGIGGFDLAFERAGFTVSWQSEIDKSASRVLARRFPGVINHGDIREISGKIGPVDVICGGFPCQDLSHANNGRSGLSGERSGLFYKMIEVINEVKPAFAIFENVPGLLSFDEGRDFAKVLSAFCDIGYGGGWRMLNAQYFGVAQRRRRVFGCFARSDIGAERAAKILSLTESVRRTSAESEAQGKEIAGTLGSRSGGGFGTELDASVAFIVSGTVSSKWAKGSGGPAGDEMYSLVQEGVGVRMLTPLECERLQGFPDGWTDGQKDARRYIQLGNAVCVPVAEYIAKRVFTELSDIEKAGLSQRE